MATKKFSLIIKSTTDELPTVEEFVSEIADFAKMDEDNMSSLLICVIEAVTNAIIHANKKDISKKVVISAELTETHLKLIIRDEGKGFNPEAVPDPTVPENILKESGRGVYLMRIYLDELKYNLTPEGLETIMILKLPMKK